MSWPEGTSPELEIETSNPIEEDSVARFVTWIPWDSGFRGSGLNVGYLIVGHDGVRYGPAELDAKIRIGDSHFSDWLKDKGLKPGDHVSVLVLRGDDTMTIDGTLGAYRRYRNADGTSILGENGPVTYEKDGFEYGWESWYEHFADLAKTILAGWDHFAGVSTRELAKQLEPFAERVSYLEQHYPSAFARAVRDDYEAMQVMVAGEKRDLTPADVAYRTLGEARAAAVTAAADRAFAAFLAEVGSSLLENPPSAPNSFTEDTGPLAGKMVRLPEVGERELLFETKGSWYWSGRSSGGGGGGYLVDRTAEGLKPLYVATNEYVEKVDPAFHDPNICFVGVAQAAPALVCDAYRNITVSGVRVAPVAALVTNAADKDRRFFADLRPGKTTEAFAGEAELEAGIARPTLAGDASPEQVLAVAFGAIKVGDMDTWLACYADWNVRRYYENDGSFLWVDGTWETMSRLNGTSTWATARTRWLDDVYGVEVVRVSSPQVVFDAATQPAGHEPGAAGPRRVEEVRVLVNHIGRVGDEYRTFAASLLHRHWELERLDDGPWRITTPYGV